MATEKKALWVVCKMDKKMTTPEWRQRFSSSYPVMLEITGLLFKCWWCNHQKNEWGALYIFDSEADLQTYLKSDHWIIKVPAKYGVKPEFSILEPGPIMCKKTITNAENSWITT